ncbi:hypothetical protein TNIN_236251 [Trichonephila inaurata madagascariensis]|uniref:Uncharacterized protein n=1 Tax=Trichonephila inaurata madagascariensis TaxID=2747483 RepID=A0A8X7CTY4_9ARAC|nr:hypothetical protein TNIN_236251 [Trichonephila inaurata madagascariensis]
MPLFLVVSKENPREPENFLSNLNWLLPKVVVEPLNKNSMPTQCHRCQLFYHHSRFCNREPKCLECGLAHLMKDSKKRTPLLSAPIVMVLIFLTIQGVRKILKISSLPQRMCGKSERKFLIPQKKNKNENKNVISASPTDAKAILEQMSLMMAQFGTMFQSVMSSLGNKI